MRVWIAAVLLTAPLRVFGQTMYTDPDAGWAIQIPAGWQRVSEDKLRKMNESASKAGGEVAVHFDAGFSPVTPEGPRSVWIARLPFSTEGLSWADWRKVLDSRFSSISTSSLTPAVLLGMQSGQALCSDERQCFSFVTNQTSPEGPVVSIMTSFVRVGEQYCALYTCNPPLANQDAVVACGLVESFSPRARTLIPSTRAQTAVPSSSSRGSIRFDYSKESIMRSLIVGASIGVLLTIALKAWMRRK